MCTCFVRMRQFLLTSDEIDINFIEINVQMNNYLKSEDCFWTSDTISFAQTFQ